MSKDICPECGAILEVVDEIPEPLPHKAHNTLQMLVCEAKDCDYHTQRYN